MRFVWNSAVRIVKMKRFWDYVLLHWIVGFSEVSVCCKGVVWCIYTYICMYANEHQKSTPINSKHSPMKLVPILTWQKYFAFVWRISSDCSRAHRIWYFRLTKNRWQFFTFVKINALEHEQIFSPQKKHPLYHQNKRFFFYYCWQNGSWSLI